MSLLRCTMTLLCLASEAGRRDARAVGEAMRAMKIAGSEVISSPY